MPLIIFGYCAETGDHIKEHYVILQTESEVAFSNIMSKFIVVKLTTLVDDSHIKLESSESLKADDATAVADANESQSLQSQIASAITNPKSKGTFQKHGITKYPWLHYEEATDTVTCSICREAEERKLLTFSTKKDESFISAGFRNKAIERLDINEKLFIHLEAVLKILQNKKTNVHASMSDAKKRLMTDNKKVLLRIISAIIFLTKQGLSLRGHLEEHGNFLQLMHLLSQDSNVISYWLKRNSCQWLSPAIQNEILTMVSNEILRNIVKNIKMKMPAECLLFYRC